MNRSVFSPRLVTSGATLVLALSVHAHPGHDWNDADARHLLTSTDHLAVLALAGIALCFGAHYVHDRLPRRLLQSAGIAAIVLAGVVWGIRA